MPEDPAPLVSLKVAMYLTGRSSAQIMEDVDCGRWLWVWRLGLSLKGGDGLRFLEAELRDAARVRHLTLDAVIDRVLPYRTRQRVSNAEFCARFQFARQHGLRLVQGGHLEGAVEHSAGGHCLWISLESLRRLLRTRLVSRM